MSISKHELKKLYDVAAPHIPPLADRGGLDTRKSDSLDFLDVAVWCLADGLAAAYRLGLSEAQGVGVKRSAIIKALESLGRPSSMEQIMGELPENTSRIAMMENLMLLVARERLETWVMDDGEIVYAICN